MKWKRLTKPTSHPNVNIIDIYEISESFYLDILPLKVPCPVCLSKPLLPHQIGHAKSWQCGSAIYTINHYEHIDDYRSKEKIKLMFSFEQSIQCQMISSYKRLYSYEKQKNQRERRANNNPRNRSKNLRKGYKIFY